MGQGPPERHSCEWMPCIQGVTFEGPTSAPMVPSHLARLLGTEAAASRGGREGALGPFVRLDLVPAPMPNTSPRAQGCRSHR